MTREFHHWIGGVRAHPHLGCGAHELNVVGYHEFFGMS